jgi:aspartyl-tRNA synthetase
MTKYRTTHAGTLRSSDIGREVRLSGWVGRRRDHGGVIFIDLRDASGIIQVVLNPENDPPPMRRCEACAASTASWSPDW